MPLFFFHLRTAQGVDQDDIGTPFPDLDAAYLDVCRAIPEMVSGLLRDGTDPLRCVFEVTDEHRQPLMEVPFAEQLTKNVARPRSAVTTFDVDDEIMIDALLRSATRNLIEARKLRSSVRTARLRLAQNLNSRNKPFLISIAQAYGVLNAGTATEIRQDS